MSIHELLPLLKCPDCNAPSVTLPAVAEQDGIHVFCDACGAKFPVASGRPVLIRHDNAVFPVGAYCQPPVEKSQGKLRRLAKLIPDPSINLAGERVMTRLRNLLAMRDSATVLVVGGGTQRKWLNQQLGAGKKIKVVYSDIDNSADVDIFCDGHDLPFVDNCIDAVVTTVVLEHVMYPERVVAEIHRVLKLGGVVYSEVPFMQQVHEGAYDFTRYSLSGHRRLFNGFTEIESGMVAGPATTLVWAIENFVLAFVTGTFLRLVSKALIRLLFAWIKFIDRWLENRPEAMDGASCTYFLGAKREGLVPDAEIISRYVGAKHLQHI